MDFERHGIHRTDGDGRLRESLHHVGSLSTLPIALGSGITKLSADGKTILWENGLGSTIAAMAVDPSGGLYLVPLAQSYSTSISVVKLSADGTSIAWNTPVGFAPPNEYPLPVLAADSQGRAYMAVVSNSNGGAKVVRLNAAGSAVDYTAELAGTPTSIAVDATGAAFVAGNTTAGQFLARFAPDGSAGFYTILAPDTNTPVVALDANGDVVVFSSGVLRRVDSTGSVTLTTMTYLSAGFALDATGNAYITQEINGQLYPVKNSIATCGSTVLSMFAPDGASCRPPTSQAQAPRTLSRS
jgi:hypothetical protein